MSDTPRTDAAARMAFTSEHMVPIEDAQKLERDLAQSKEANAGLMRACDHLERELADMTKQRNHYKAACDQYSEDEMLCKLQEVTKQRDALAEALEKAKIAEMQLENADINLEQCRLNFVGRIKKLEQERDALAEAGNQLLDSLYSQDWRKLPAIRSMRKALAATKGGSHE